MTYMQQPKIHCLDRFTPAIEGLESHRDREIKDVVADFNNGQFSLQGHDATDGDINIMRKNSDNLNARCRVIRELQDSIDTLYSQSTREAIARGEKPHSLNTNT